MGYGPLRDQHSLLTGKSSIRNGGEGNRKGAPGNATELSRDAGIIALSDKNRNTAIYCNFCKNLLANPCWSISFRYLNPFSLELYDRQSVCC